MTVRFISWSSSSVISGVTYMRFDLNREPSKLFSICFWVRFRKFLQLFFRIFTVGNVWVCFRMLVYLNHRGKGKQDWICINWLIIIVPLVKTTALKCLIMIQCHNSGRLLDLFSEVNRSNPARDLVRSGTQRSKTHGLTTVPEPNKTSLIRSNCNWES